ncbi:DNA-binding transcriptional MerR regulator [Nocardiopsis sp. Huas11]|uniref:MerR family transcriptional regulator n=1 Tax=Nocardiopsis sp. Huas11 TaxID=2183912 RepID=UPI000EB52536|nr:MerR family transcriptional regulator [Nocardiopsis sp. Huas11]RKS05078.1 DNA-binding transcriptional MerR regulator [Nocardiopsis sp. Huas11]
MPEAHHMRIGEVAERTGLSLRTIRYYGEVALVEPSARSRGGFRLYTESDVDRLQLIKRMKPLGFSLEQTRELLESIDRLGSATTGEDERAALSERLDAVEADLAERCSALRRQLEMAEEFAERLRRKRAHHADD